MIKNNCAILVVSLLMISGCLSICTTIWAETPTTKFKDNDWLLAMNSNMAWGKAYAKSFVPTGARWVRISQTANTPIMKEGAYDWTVTDMAINALDEPTGDARLLNALCLLGYAPAWAAPEKDRKPVGNWGSSYASINEPWDSPKNIYGRYVFDIITRYKNRVKYWQTWNEPDLPGHGYFSGDGKDFAKYQRVAYLNAKKADPTCFVTFPSMTYGNSEGYMALHGLKAPTPSPAKACFFADYLAEVKKDPEAAKNNYYFDIVCTHPYTRAAAMWDYAEVLKRTMKEADVPQKPIWVTEMGTEINGSIFGAKTHQEYCDYEIQAHVYAKQAGIARVFHFQLDDSNECGIYFRIGPEAKDSTPKPMFYPYSQVIAPYIAPSKFVKQHHGQLGSGVMDGKDIFQNSIVTGYAHFELQMPDKRAVHVLWADGPESPTVKVPAAGKGATIIRFDRSMPDADNLAKLTAEQVSPKNGTYEIKLEANKYTHGWPTGNDEKCKAMGKPEYSVGGPSVLLIEPALDKLPALASVSPVEYQCKACGAAVMVPGSPRYIGCPKCSKKELVKK